MTSRREEGERSWNGKPKLLVVENHPISGLRTLENIVQNLEPLMRQGKVERFFKNTQNTNKLVGLVEDVHKAVVDYQVRSQSKRPHLPHT